MWLQRLLARIHSHPGPIVIEGGEAYGGPFIVDALSKAHRVAWLQLSATEANDYIALGNRLAEAVNRALEANFLPHALPFSYSVEVLKKRLPILGPMVIACSNAEFNPLFRDALLELNSAHAKVILIVGGPSSAVQDGLHLKRGELALNAEEAEELAGPYFTSQERRTLEHSSGGAYLPFLNSVRRLRGEPLPYVPSPQGNLTAPGTDAAVSPEALLEVLCKLGRHTEALDLAVMSLPERVPEVLREAGPAYQEQGLLARLHLLLESLDNAFQRSEEVLEWRLVAAFSQSAHGAVAPLIEKYLQENEAPNLRARFAGTISDPVQRFAEVQRAAAHAATPLTLFQLGRVHPNPSEGINILQKSVRLAEEQRHTYDVVRNAGMLAQRLMHLGRFEEALNWSEWALQFIDKFCIKDGQRRFRILNDWAYLRILLGQTFGLKEVLSSAEEGIAQIESTLANVFRSTQADLELILGNVEQANKLAAENLVSSSRLQTGRLAVFLVRILLEQGEDIEAVKEGSKAVALTQGENSFYSLPSTLALGMALTTTQPQKASELLAEVVAAHHLEAALRVIASLYLIKLGKLTLQELPEEIQYSLKSLSPIGLKLLSGPEQTFSHIWEAILKKEKILRIRVLGRQEVWFNDEPIDLSGRALEVLVLLALHPDGLTAEALHAKLYEDEDIKLVALRSAVSRLRNLIPISSYPQPYKITVPYYFDALACEEALGKSNLRSALELYRGPLLYKSDAPGVREARLYLEERLRQTALLSGDAETLVPLAETLGDDAEVWQAAHSALTPGDPRTPLVRAHLQRVTQELQPVYN